MNDQQLDRLLRTIGKRCYENCYKIATQKGDNLTIKDLVTHDPALKGTKETALRTRLNAIKRIVREGPATAKKALIIAKNRKK